MCCVLWMMKNRVLWFGPTSKRDRISNTKDVSIIHSGGSDLNILRSSLHSENTLVLMLGRFPSWPACISPAMLRICPTHYRFLPEPPTNATWIFRSLHRENPEMRFHTSSFEFNYFCVFVSPFTCVVILLCKCQFSFNLLS